MIEQKDIKKPWEGTNMDERKYLNWMRENVRNIWKTNPTKNAFKKSKAVKAPLGMKTKKEPGGRLINGYKCSMCGEIFKSEDIEVDHIKPGGSFSDWEEFSIWAKRVLWVDFEDLRLLCKDKCHQLVTYSQRHNLSLEDSEIMIKVSKSLKQKKVDKQKEELLSYGFTDEEISNAAKRRACYVKYFREEG